MSTLGGSRGERQAKPKFAALDINRLYKNSRGESLEPSTQKNQVPRKHGMQILGKVPTSRRPPANLPSLKAETLTPGSSAQEQGGNQVGGSNSATSVQSANLNSTATSNSISNTQTLSASSTSTSSQQATTNSSSLSANSSGTHLSSYSSSSNLGGSSSSSVTWSSVTTGHDGGSSSLPPLYQSPQFQHEFPSLDGSTPNSISHKSHHKDSHYYGGRDGNGGGGGGRNTSDGGSQLSNKSDSQSGGDVQLVSLRPQTDASLWIQQQQQSGSGKGGDPHGTQQGQAHLQAAPPQFRALMPSFMNRGGVPIPLTEQTSGSGARPLTPPVQLQQSSGGGSNSGGGGSGGGGGTGSGGGTGGQQHHQQNGNFSAPVQPTRHNRPSGPKDQRPNSPYQPSNSTAQDNFSGRGSLPKRTQGQSGPRFNQRSEASSDNSTPYIEPEDVLVQRPIIKEEDLERMDSIAKDDAWTRQDEIDYNQKLVFSDDESPDSHLSGKTPHSMGKRASQKQTDEDNRAVWAREREHMERLEREHLERERNERNEREHRSALLENSRENIDRERGRDTDRVVVERDRGTDNRSSSTTGQRIQQNGHRGALEPAVYERVKQRKEEEEKREMERKQAAAKKLQELEMKIGAKKTDEDGDDLKGQPNDEEYSSSRGRSYRSEKEGRDFGRYEKYERDVNQRERDPNYKDNYSSGVGGSSSAGAAAANRAVAQKAGSQFSVHFQSNLPPRFLRQQQQQDRFSGPTQPANTSSGERSSGGASGGPSNRSITANHQQQSGYHSSSESSQKSVPFAQQYDPRYIHSQNYKQQTPQLLRRNPSDEMMPNRRNDFGPGSSGRRRGDSEDDDRFSSSGRESISRNSIGEQQPPRGGNVTPQLARSISDSSQRKTSVSSNDEQKLSESFQSQRSDSREFAAVGSWAEESDLEMTGKQRRESASTDHSYSKQDSSQEEPLQPKHILQRPQTKSISEGKKEEGKADFEIAKKDDSLEVKSHQQLMPTQILRRSESPKRWSESSADKTDTKGASDATGHSVQDNVSNADEHKKTEPNLDTKEKGSTASAADEARKDTAEATIGSKKESSDEKTDDQSAKHHAGQKRPSPRGGRLDPRGPPSRSYGMYRGSRPDAGWNRRGGGGRMGDRRNYNSHLSESEGSDEFDDDYHGGHRMERSSKFPRKDSVGKQEMASRGGPMSSKDGFAPRGEPSRRGRGGGGSGSSSYRRGGGISSGPKRSDSYGGGGSQQSSKPAFGAANQCSNEDKVDKGADRKQVEQIDDKAKLNTVASNASGKKSGDSSDESKNRSKAQSFQSSARRDEKKSPPKSFGSSHYQPQPPRRDNASLAAKSDPIGGSKIDDEDVRKDSQIDSDLRSRSNKDKEFTQRSNSSTHLSTSRSSYPKKDDRGVIKPGSKPGAPPSSGFKPSISNLSQNGQQQQHSQSQPQHKDQILSKSKSTGDARGDLRDSRGDNRNGAKTNLPPRLAKQWDGRGGKRDGNPIDNSSSNQGNSGNAGGSTSWDKPSQQPQLPQGTDVKSSQEPDNSMAQQQSLADGKCNVSLKVDPTKQMLDGSTTPVNTIIFENTNYKTVAAPIKRQPSNQGPQQLPVDAKKPEDIYKTQQDVAEQNRSIQQQTQQSQPGQQMQLSQQQIAQQQMHHQQQQQEAITTALSQMSFNKSENDYDKDIKLGFTFDTEFSHLTDEKNAAAAASKASLGLPRSSSVIHSVSSTSHNTISPSTADLNMKIASVKKVWETMPSMPPVLEHAPVVPNADAESHLASNFVQSQHQQHMHHFAAAGAALHAAHGGNMHVQHSLSSPGPPSYTNTFDPNMDPHFGAKDSGVVVGNVTGNANENDTGGYSPSPQHVGQQQQQQPQNPNNVQNMSLKHAVESNVCKVKPNQQQLHQTGLGMSPPPTMQQGTTQMHQAPQQFYQPSQFGAMPTIPSPPAVLFNSSPMPSQGGLYGPFQIDAGRSQFSQFPAHYGTAGSGPYSAYMQTPPNMPTAPGPDMYPSLTSQFRMGGTVQTPFNQSQQLNNPNTVLISSSSNSLMSASVKPSSQQIGAIGSKSNAAAVAAAAASVGQPYGQQYMNLYPPPQQAPPQLQSNSYYTNSAGGQGAAFFGGPQATGATQSYGLQAAGIFGGHGGPGPSNAPPQQQIANFSSQFINSPLLAATAINQYRGGPNPQNAPYMKSNQNQNHMQDSMGRQLKSPLSSEVSLNLAKQVQPQQSPPHHKNYAPSWDQMMQQQQQHQPNQQNQQNRNSGPNNLNSGRPGGPGAQRYPAPIQRPTIYPTHQPPSQQNQSQRPVRQPHSGGPGGSGSMNKHYYGNSGGGRGGHSSNPGEHSMKPNDKNIEGTTQQQEMSIKDEGGNE